MWSVSNPGESPALYKDSFDGVSNILLRVEPVDSHLRRARSERGNEDMSAIAAHSKSTTVVSYDRRRRTYTPCAQSLARPVVDND